MALISAYLDTVKGRLVAQQVVSFADDDFVSTGQTQFQATADITASNQVDVFVNGVVQREGASHDFQRDINNDRINFNYTVQNSAWVRVRIYAGIITFSESTFEVSGAGQSVFTVAQDITPSSKIDVLVNGVLAREGATYDYLRNNAGDSVDFNYTVLAGAVVRVRVYT